MLSWKGGQNTSIVCSIVHQLLMTMLSTDCRRWSTMSCLMNSQLSLKQRKQFSICQRARPLVQTQYLRRSTKREVSQWQTNLQSCFTACGGNKAIPQEFKDASIIHLCKGKEMFVCDISLLSIALKILAKILLNRLNEHLDQIGLLLGSKRNNRHDLYSKATPSEMSRTIYGPLYDLCRPHQSIRHSHS